MSALAEAVRAGDRLSFLSQLFAPEAARPALETLAAYRLELDRIVANAREPLAAEVRLQWWRDAIRNEGYGAGASVELVDRLRAAAERYRWPLDTLVAMSEARIHDLYSDPFEDWTAFDGYAGETRGAEFQLGAMALGVEQLGPDEGVAAARSAATAAGYGAVALTAAARAVRAQDDLIRARSAIPADAFEAATGVPLADALSHGTPPEGMAVAIEALIAHGEDAFGQFRDLVPAVHHEVRAALLPAMVSGAMLQRARRTLPLPRSLPPHRVAVSVWLSARALRKAR